MNKEKAPIYEKIKAYADDESLLNRLMDKGQEKAHASSSKTISEVREIIGFR